MFDSKHYERRFNVVFKKPTIKEEKMHGKTNYVQLKLHLALYLVGIQLMSLLELLPTIVFVKMKEVGLWVWEAAIN